VGGGVGTEALKSLEIHLLTHLHEKSRGEETPKACEGKRQQIKEDKGKTPQEERGSRSTTPGKPSEDSKYHELIGGRGDFSCRSRTNKIVFAGCWCLKAKCDDFS